MEGVDDVYEARLVVDYHNQKYPYPQVTKWFVKDSIQRGFYKNTLVAGDMVCINSKPSAMTNKRIDAYLQSLGCTRVKETLATKFVDNRSNWSYSFTNSLSKKPVEVESCIVNRHKFVGDNFFKQLSDWEVETKDKFGFDVEAYKNIWNLLKSSKVDNTRMAAMGIMTCDWTGNELLLRFAMMNFNGAIRSAKLATIPGWTAFCNKHKLMWKCNTIEGHYVISLIKDCYETSQMDLIHKLLNN